MPQKIIPSLWFHGDAEQAVSFYVTLLPDSRVDRIVRAPADTPAGPEGSVLVVEFTLAGQSYLALNGGPEFRFTEAVSFQILTDDQDETNRLWAAITGNGGAESMCGWCKDRWGLSWQITPRRLMELNTGPDRDRARRSMQAMMGMHKIDIATLERAADGN
ncbi:VOC family protein [Sphingomonas sp. S2-65]|uniref:VOC family protein n=1 Tax=Sphingomonas sp. S2-65 TaxID=2903960 RepID=UPI001F262394|nr:VOC family protein [Sphingomonas sp. S2-65]UYY58128.1 VOC family protein [Sphingomonas sp. S2-65]